MSINCHYHPNADTVESTHKGDSVVRCAECEKILHRSVEA